MTLSLESAKTWVKSNPLLAAGIGILAFGAVALAVSPKIRQSVGLGKAPVRHRSKKTKTTVKRLK
jgi:hypothetical protein